MLNKEYYKLIPKVDDLLNDDKLKELIKIIPRVIILDSIREELEILRDMIKNQISQDVFSKKLNDIIENIQKNANIRYSYKLRRVINATGVILHTNLGRSLLNDDIMEHVKYLSTYYSNLEFDIEKGIRGSRYSHTEDLINKLIGCEASMIVNNNAAAVMLVLSTIAADKEVIVSRGELIEIGGSFRIPDVMRYSSAILREVGTTNKTHLYDYEEAINENTAAIMKIHTSNYRVLGFTESVDQEQLMSLKEKHTIPIIEDLGSGVLIDLSKYGLEYEPTVQESIKKGVDIVTFSGDKLLGGPQCGVIVGKKDIINKMKKNPLTRALRVDKLVISALESTLRYYLDEDMAVKNIPTLNMLTMKISIINSKAHDLVKLLDKKFNDEDLIYTIEDDFSEVGGGSMPLEKLPTKCIVLRLKNYSIQKFEDNLRKYNTPIIARVYKNSIYFDIRTIMDDEIMIVADGIEFALNMLKEC